MDEAAELEGVIAVLLERLEKYRIPRLLAIKESVDSGNVLTDSELAFLEKAMGDAGSTLPKLEKHKEFQLLASKIVVLYKEISGKALENESRS